MPGTAMPKQHGLLTFPPLASLLALAALAGLLGLSGCSPRKPIPLDQPRIATTPAPEAQPQPAPVKAAKAAKAPQAKAAPAKPAPEAKADAKVDDKVEATTEAQASPEAVAPEAQAQPAPEAPAAVERKVYVQVGAFGTAMNALGAVAWLKGKGYEDARMVRVEQGQGALFRVQAGPFQDLAAAHKALGELKPDWPQAFIPLD